MIPSYGICVGRFQVPDLHDGHMELFRQVRARHNGVIVFIGVHPAGLTKDNPLDFPTRKAMIQAKFPEFTVLPLLDCRDDYDWSFMLDALIGSVVTGQADVTLYGGRDSFVPHYKGKYKPVELTLPIDTQKINGTDIRNELSNKVIESPEFRAGMIYASAHHWPVVLPTVDIAIFNSDYTEVLLGRRAKEKQYRFIGGHVGINHENYEDAARHEVLEESGLDPNEMQYIASSAIYDWRYLVSDRSVKTVFFATTVMSMGARAGDDIDEVRWFQLSKLSQSDLVSEHRTLYTRMLHWLSKRKKVTAHAS